jgi:hypothetical protein
MANPISLTLSLAGKKEEECRMLNQLFLDRQHVNLFNRWCFRKLYINKNIASRALQKK